jgi:hypothetical protein
MNPHTPKGAPTLWVGVLVDSWMFKERLQGLKPNGLKSSLYHWKDIETQMSKMGSHDPFGHLKHKLSPNEGSKVKLAIWLPTTKSWESTWFPYMQVACNTSLEILNQGYNFTLDLISIKSLHTKLRAPKLRKSHLDVGLMERHKVYYKGEGGGFPQVRVVVSLVNLSLPMARPSTKSAPTMHLPPCVGFVQVRE